MDPRAGITRIDGVAVPFDYVSVDTDAMFPVSSETIAREQGYGAALFGRWRDDPTFILNRQEYVDAEILVAGPQFGIGSSRETAVWALVGAGFRAVLAPSFGEIFRSNCVRNGVLTAVVDQNWIDELQTWLRERPGDALSIDLHTDRVSTADGTIHAPIAVDGFARRCLIDGLDEFQLLADYRSSIERTLAAVSGWLPNTFAVEALPQKGQ